jgi:hypothetical protein
MLASLRQQVAVDFSKRPYDRVPYPASYLRAGQWENEVKPTSNGTKSKWKPGDDFQPW